MAATAPNHEMRLSALRAELEGQHLDSMILTDPVSIRWAVGFTGSNGAVIISPDTLTVLTDGRYQIQVAAELAAAGLSAEVIIERDRVVGLAGAVAPSGRFGLEADRITWAEKRGLSDAMGDDVELVAVTRMVAELRRVKDRWELGVLERASALADQALAAVVPVLGSGVTEREVARRIDDQMLRLGADSPSFATIVASGPNSARPHARPTDREIGDGDLLIIDMGARVDGYGSDMTRTFFIGEVSDQQRAMYNAVVASQAAGVAAVADGVSELAIDQACRDSLATVGMADAFIHGTGHGLGLEIHEEPFISARSTGRLQVDQAITVEPGVYVEGLGGVRIEDTVVVTASGCLTITKSPKTPEVTYHRS